MLTKEIVFGEGTEYKRILIINRPKGAAARAYMPEVIKFMQHMRKAFGDKAMLEENDLLEVILTFWEMEKFEKELVPFVLNLDNPDGRKYLQENGTMGEILEAFLEASQWLVVNSFGRPEVQEALGKSPEAAEK